MHKLLKVTRSNVCFGTPGSTPNSTGTVEYPVYSVAVAAATSPIVLLFNTIITSLSD
jgi:hypothetical protein